MRNIAESTGNDTVIVISLAIMDMAFWIQSLTSTISINRKPTQVLNFIHERVVAYDRLDKKWKTAADFTVCLC